MFLRKDKIPLILSIITLNKEVGYEKEILQEKSQGIKM